MPDAQGRGSVLIEQLLATALLGLLVVSLFSLLTTGSLAARMAQELALAGDLAAHKLEEITGSWEEAVEVARRPLDPERFPKYEWQVAVAEVDSGLQQVTVTVWWPRRGRERSVNLTTLVRRSEER
ncbi:MAG: hypothetical protein ACT4P5_18920 [Armatimonadota bacterium]